MKNSKKLFKEAKKYIPGGVNSPVRAFSSVNSTPFFIKKAKGQYLFDEDNKRYIDFIGSWGAQILGHADNRILKVLDRTMKNGNDYPLALLMDNTDNCDFYQTEGSEQTQKILENLID